MNFFARGLRFIKARYAPRGARQIFSQYGEDLIMSDIMSKRGIKELSYVDLGAHHPIVANNTYLFYRNHGSGVLVEPNAALCDLIRRKRPRDICLNAGAGRVDGKADFYVFPQSTRSTFSAELAKAWVAASGQKCEIEQHDLVSLNTIIRDHCQGKAPTVVSMDAEGLDLEILSGFGWQVRPFIFCVELSDGIEQLMGQQGYELQARILQNAIFVHTNK